MCDRAADQSGVDQIGKLIVGGVASGAGDLDSTVDARYRLSDRE
jgi:hypothetical protein